MKFIVGITMFFAAATIFVHAQSREQTTFAMEEEIKKPHSIPKYVVREIIRNDENSQASDFADFSGRLKGALVNLNNDRRPDLLVQGDPGANITGFWLFRNAGGKWKMVFYTRAAWLDLLKTSNRNFYDVEIHAATAVKMWGSLYKFDGRRYVPQKCWEEAESGKKSQRKYYRCSGSSVKPYV